MSKIYPNLEYVSEDSRDYKKHESNCGQIFSKGTAITRDILEKLEETEIGPKHTVICGQEFNTKQLWVLAGLLLLFLSSSMGVALMFATSMFDGYVLSNLAISNNTVMYENWKGPYVSTFIKVYIFNYTNVDEYERGNADKLHVEEIGPFVYEELITKINIKFYPNDTVSYQEKRTHKFRADLSKGRKQSDRVIVPNMPLMAAAAASENSYYFSRLALSTLLSTMDSKPFLSLPAHRFIWGYDDSFYTLVKGVMSYEKKMPYEKIGLLTSRNGTSEDVVTVYTGKNDVNKVGQIDSFNGQNKLNHWSVDECNKIQGSDGMLFPPYTIRQKNPVHIYFKELCRRFPMVFEKEVKLLNGKVPAYKYVLPENVFDLPENNAENQCFCDMESGSCAPQGLFNSTPCAFGVPAFVSFPHFYKADPSIRNAISGLKSGAESHESYFNIHPTLGFVISGVSRLQMNVQVKKSFGMSQLDMFEENMMLPISWLEAGVETENLPENARNDIYTLSVTIPTVETLLKVAFLLTTLVTLVAIVIVLYGKYRERAQKLRKLKRSNSSWSREEESIS